MRHYRATREDLEYYWSILEEFERIGYRGRSIVHTHDRKIYIEECLEKFYCIEFEPEEIDPGIPFELFAVKFCKDHFQDFKTLEEKEKNDSDQILEFVIRAKYGDVQKFKNACGDIFTIHIIPGGYVYKTLDMPGIFVSHEQVIQDMNLRWEKPEE